MTEPIRVASPDGDSHLAFTAAVTWTGGDGTARQLEVGGGGEPETDATELPGGLGARLRRWHRAGEAMAVTLELARLEAGRAAARLSVTNTGADAVCLQRLTPVSVVPGSLRLGDTPVADWTYLRQPRKKNDMPAAIRLGDTRPGVLDAARGTPETGGPPPGGWGDSLPTRFVSSEATALGAGDRGLLLGVLPAHLQLVTCQLQLTEARDALTALDVHCEGDGQRLDPSAGAASAWVVLDLTRPPLQALTAHAETLAAAYEDPNRGRDAARPPTVWCSWYYYGDGHTQAEAEANVGWLEAHPLPVDVFQIDECWDRRWGDWEANPDWPDLPGLARRLRQAGIEPGIWTCPFLAEPRSRLRYQHPDWLLRNAEGGTVHFSMSGMQAYVLDPTHPEVQTYLEDLYRRLTEWGYSYHKLDFTRGVAEPGGVFHDPTKNRAQAYRMGLEAVRRGMGSAGYLNVCGGLYGPALGLANAQRTGSDVKSIWPAPPEGEAAEGYGPFTIKQNTLRFWLNRLGHNDPDALMVRRRPQAYRGERLSLGLMSDEEALTSSLNQYLGGGIVCFTEPLPEIDADRLLLLRHCAPSVGDAAWPLDAVDGTRFPGLFLTRVTPAAAGLGPWVTLAFVNWHDEARTFDVPLDAARQALGIDASAALLATSFRHGTTDVVAADAELRTEPLPPHGCEVLKVQAARAGQAHLLHGDGHFSMGGTELTSWTTAGDEVDLVVDWPWPCPLQLAVGWLEGERVVTRSVLVPAGARGHETTVSRG